MRARKKTNAKGGYGMIRAWYEKIRDEKDELYFHHRHGVEDARTEMLIPGFHSAVEFAFGIKGDAKVVIDGQTYHLREGEICFIDSLVPHNYYYNEGVECFIVLVSPGFFNDVNRLGEISFPTHIERSAHFEILRRFLTEAEAGWDGDSLLYKRIFADTLAYLMTKHCEFSPKRDKEQKNLAILDAIRYISEHYAERLTVEDVSKKMGYSPGYFSTFFNQAMGIGFSDYLNTCRVVEYRRICRENPGIAAYKAAQMCGFGSMNTFYRAVKRYHEQVKDAASRAEESLL